MIFKLLQLWKYEEDAQYRPYRKQLRMKGLDEGALRRMDPDARVAALERANLDPYDFLFLAWA